MNTVKSLLMPLSESRHRFEFFLLAGMLASLTLSRSLQSIFFISFSLLWLINRYLDHQWGGAWNYWDSLIALWILASVAVDVSGVVYGLKWSVISDFARYSTFLWLVSRSNFSKNQLLVLFIILIVTGLIGLGIAYYNTYFLGHLDLEIPQVGHQNHSAVYIELLFIINLSVLLSYWPTLKLWQKTILIISALIFLNALFNGLSRAAIAVGIGNAAIAGIILSRRKLIYSFILIITLVLIVLSSWIHPFHTKNEPLFHEPKILEKQRDRQKTFEKNIISDRAEFRQISLWVWKKHALFGSGIHNFQPAAKAVITEKSFALGHPITFYKLQSHAHNLYFNVLAEEGVVGLSALCFIFIAWIFLLLRYLPNRSSNDFYWALWLSSFFILLSNLIIGWANTPFHHQNALLSLLTLGLSIGYFKRHLIHDDH